jgi:hypothetical protein
MKLTKRQKEQKLIYESETGFDVMDCSDDFDECLRASVFWFEWFCNDAMLKISNLGKPEIDDNASSESCRK